ncbi:MAG: tRNA (adenosine(37)-N6)-dimethylallyltransferase MiaA [Mariniphaga sp.]|nr:tRNA (adenosine(37)-N6)-dimethylallyltransferase MiaA [Mariniphaga sp.]MDD4226231.1 tRNA (adenosine(37)-N6)-dimethylallyltransferase MiaA [Mariniphaga sp.]
MAKNLIIVTGPTAIGKTGAAIQLATHFQTEIVSADSRQIYRELSIGTAVPSAKELAKVKHHFIHTHSIFDTYNASRYESEALQLLEQLFQKYETVVMTGGSMLYLDAVCYGIDAMPDVDVELRQILKGRLEKEGIESLRMQLKRLDPAYYSKADLKNPARILHALEICLQTGKPYSSFLSSKPQKRPFSILKTGLTCDRSDIHNRINQRVDQMLQTGLEEEALRHYPFQHLNALNTVGYQEFFNFFGGIISKDEAIRLIKRNTRRYARKQLTWFRKDKELTWFHPQDIIQLIHFIEQNIKNDK